MLIYCCFFFFFFSNKETLKGFGGGFLWFFSSHCSVFFLGVRFLVCIVICMSFKNIHCTCLLLQVDHH